MEAPLRLILVIAPLIAGAIAIFFAFQLMRRYSQAFSVSYFYYVVFLYIFGAYSLTGSGVLEHLFISMEVDQDTIHSARLFNILLGIPLIVLSKYMLLRSFAELLSKKIHLAINIGYFSLTLIFFVLYGIAVVRFTWFEQGDFQWLLTVQRWIFGGFMAGIYTAVFIMSLTFSRKSLQHDRSFARNFGSWYFLFMILTCIPLLLSDLHEIVPYLFIIVFFSWHLIPILFLSIYLEKYHGEKASVRHDFGELLQAFTGKYEISRREEEVIRLICKGLSNQEISDALYISLQTVKDHIHHIFVKTGVKNRVQLTNMIGSG